MINQTCWSCKYIRLDNAQPHYSSWTPGSPMDLFCGKSKWRLDQYKDTLEMFRQKIESARECELFDER